MLKVYSFLILSAIATQFVLTEARIVESFRYKRSEDCQRNSISFKLYTRNNLDSSEVIILDDKQSLTNSNFNPSWPVRFIIHGLRENENSEINQLLKDEYLKKDNFNVIVVDSSQCWDKFIDIDVISNEIIEFVGGIVKDFAEFLHTEIDVDFDNMYLIGHRLGAHVAGYAGHFLKSGKFHTIFALDPAGPAFEGTNIDFRIDSSDASYVESIHPTIFWHYDKPIGHASFYPNYEKDQRCGPACDFLIAYKYFAKTINMPEIYKGIKCESYEDIMGETCTHSDVTGFMGGEPSNNHNEGIYYVIHN